MIAVGASVGFLVTIALCPFVIRELERRAVLDTAGERSSHSVPTPRGGGLGLAIGACLGAAVASARVPRSLLVVVAVGVAFGTLGLVDDLGTISARRRLILQLAISALAVFPLTSSIASGAVLLVLLPIAWLWLVAYVNAFNFMDGINGISAAQVIVAGSAWALAGIARDAPLVTAGGLVIASSAAAFLPFNFPRARVFLGDIGSYFLGAWLAAMVLVVLGEGLPLEVAVAPVALYVADTGTTLVRRVARRTSWMEPHREHAYQQLVIGGWTHDRTTAFVAAAISLCALLGCVSLAGNFAARVAADVGLLLLVIGYLLSPVAQQALRRRGRPGSARGLA